MSTKRIVLDTNVLISSIAFPNSLPDQTLRKVLTGGVLIFSHATIAEFKEVLFRPKFDRYINQKLRQDFFFEIVTSAMLVKAKPCDVICRDGKDQKFLEILAEGEVGLLITGDQDLLVLKNVGDCQIVSPATFLGIAED
jgi:putative PIN family toxin of toxin-antitoxin system